jgi:hypothetical protein
MRISETGRNSLARQINDARFVASELFGVRICANENDAIALDRDCLGERLLVVNGVDISVNENCLDGFRAGRDAAHEQQDSSDSSHQPDSSVILGKNASPARTEIFFLPSGGVFIESAHTVSAARATLTLCSSETATNFCQFYRREKLAAADQFETGPLTLWRTFSRAGQTGCH